MTGNKQGCRQVRDWLSEYLDGVLRADRAAAVKAHLESCPACREELDSLAQVTQALRALPVVRAPRSFALRPAAVRVAPAPQRRGWTWAWGMATAAASLTLALLLAGDVTGFLPEETALTPVSPAPSVMTVPPVTPSPEPAPEVDTPLRAAEAVPGDTEGALPPAGEPEIELGAEAAPLEKAITGPEPVLGAEPDLPTEAFVEAAPAPSLAEPTVEAGGWPLLQIELVLAALTLVLLSMTGYSLWRSKTRVR